MKTSSQLKAILKCLLHEAISIKYWDGWWGKLIYTIQGLHMLALMFEKDSIFRSTMTIPEDVNFQISTSNLARSELGVLWGYSKVSFHSEVLILFYIENQKLGDENLGLSLRHLNQTLSFRFGVQCRNENSEFSLRHFDQTPRFSNSEFSFLHYSQNWQLEVSSKALIKLRVSFLHHTQNRKLKVGETREFFL